MAFSTQGIFDRARDVSSINYAEVKPFLKWVYAWMFVGLLTTAGVAAFVASTPSLVALALNPIVAILSFIVQIGLVIALSAMIKRLSPTAAAMMFMVYAALLGFSLSMVFIAFSLGSIAVAFGTTALLFGAMTMFGFTTNIDLTRFQGIFMMGLIGLFIAIIINVIVGSSFLQFIISLFGVVLFMGLTAYDTQNLKRMATAPELQADGTMVAKYAIFGALGLYINFINIFLFLLQLMGGSSD
ncbi:MAG: Bax inhibitor-1/YccA family protein [Chloroflexota bacterium]|nr:Bax inhibitor-1/YccA family protein [Chloroflexota bacterium]